jgi:hypothetical protein
MHRRISHTLNTLRQDLAAKLGVCLIIFKPAIAANDQSVQAVSILAK